MIDRIHTTRQAPAHPEHRDFPFLSDQEFSDFSALKTNNDRFDYVEVKIRDLIQNDSAGITVIQSLVATQKIRDQSMLEGAELSLDLGTKYQAIRDANPIVILALNEARGQPELLQLPLSKIVAHFSADLAASRDESSPSEIERQIADIKRMHNTLPPPLPDQE